MDSHTAFSGLLVYEESVELRNVHRHCVSLVHGNVFKVVLITLVFGKIDKYLRKEHRQTKRVSTIYTQAQPETIRARGKTNT